MTIGDHRRHRRLWREREQDEPQPQSRGQEGSHGVIVRTAQHARWATAGPPAGALLAPPLLASMGANYDFAAHVRMQRAEVVDHPDLIEAMQEAVIRIECL